MIQNSARRYQLLQHALRDSQTRIVIADNVAVYYADTPKQEWAVTGEDCARVVPPFNRFLIEWIDPGYVVGPGGVRHKTAGLQCGSFFFSIDRATVVKMRECLGSNIGDELLDEARWFLWIHHFIVFEGQAVLVPFWDLVFVNQTGEPLDHAISSEMGDQESFPENGVADEVSLTHSLLGPRFPALQERQST